MSHEKKDSALQKMQLILLSAAIMIVLAQLNINLIINGFKILHRYPKKLLRYFSFTSLSTNCCKRFL